MKLKIIFAILALAVLLSGCGEPPKNEGNGTNTGLETPVQNTLVEVKMDELKEPEEAAHTPSEGDAFFEKISYLKNVEIFTLKRDVKLIVKGKEEYSKKQEIHKGKEVLRIKESPYSWFIKGFTTVECTFSGAECEQSGTRESGFNRFFDNARIFSFLKGISIEDALDEMKIEDKGNSTSYARPCKLYRISAEKLFSGIVCLDSVKGFIVFAKVEADDGSSYFESIDSFSEMVDPLEIMMPEYEERNNVAVKV